MCSIFGVLDIKTDAGELRKKALELSRLMRHRGPDCQAFTPAIKRFWLTNVFPLLMSTLAHSRCITRKKRTRLLLTVKFTTIRRCALSTAIAMRFRPAQTAK